MQRFAEQHGGILLPREDVADRRRDRRRGKARGGDLIEQRREQVMVGAVDYRHFDRRLAQALRGPQAAEAATEDQDAFHGESDRYRM
jgi:hypothetical protein